MSHPNQRKRLVDRKAALVNNLDLAFTPTKKRCIEMLESWTKAPYRFTWPQIAAMHGVEPQTLHTTWLDPNKRLTRTAIKLIWVLYTFAHKRETLWSVRSIATWGKLP